MSSRVAPVEAGRKKAPKTRKEAGPSRAQPTSTDTRTIHEDVLSGNDSALMGQLSGLTGALYQMAGKLEVYSTAVDRLNERILELESQEVRESLKLMFA